MRVTSMLADMQYYMQQSAQLFSNAEEQLSTGLRVNRPSDDPVAAALYIGSLADSSRSDSYTSNVSSLLSRLQTGDSAIAGMVTTLTSAISVGTQGANSTNNAANREGMAQQVEGLLSSIVSQANTSYEGTYLFAGTANHVPPFTQAYNAYTTSNSALKDTTALQEGSTTTISDAATGMTFSFEAAAGNTVADLKSAIAGAVKNGTLSSDVSATLSSAGQLQFHGASGMVVKTDDAVLGETSVDSSLSSSKGSLTNATVLNAGSVTKITDAATGKSLTFRASSGDTVATLKAAVSNAVANGTLPVNVKVNLTADGKMQITGSDGLAISTNDAALGAFSDDGSTTVDNAYAYVGNDGVNRMQVGDTMTVDTNVAGDTLFGSGTGVLKSLKELISALRSGNIDKIASATTAVSTALDSLSTARVPLDNIISQLQTQETYLGNEKVTLTSRQESLVKIDMTEAATNVTQAQMVNNATLAAAAKSMGQTLLDYLK